MFSSLPSQLPGLINLSFQNNNLQFFKDIDCFPGRDLFYLRELVFVGNPLVGKEMAKTGGELKYRRYVLYYLPKYHKENISFDTSVGYEADNCRCHSTRYF